MVRSLVSTVSVEPLWAVEEEAAPEEAVLEELPAVEPQAASARARVRAVRVIASFFIKITPFSFANTAQLRRNFPVCSTIWNCAVLPCVEPMQAAGPPHCLVSPGGGVFLRLLQGIRTAGPDYCRQKEKTFSSPVSML